MKAWKKLTPEQQKMLAEIGKSLEQQAFESAKGRRRARREAIRRSRLRGSQDDLDEWKKWQALFQQVSFPKFRAEVPGGAPLLDASIALYK
jgi:TRAP-type transport system periplasmic protein